MIGGYLNEVLKKTYIKRQMSCLSESFVSFREHYTLAGEKKDMPIFERRDSKEKSKKASSINQCKEVESENVRMGALEIHITFMQRGQ